jgi:hypothetical protein
MDCWEKQLFANGVTADETRDCSMIKVQSTNDFREISRADGTEKRMSESKSKHDLIWSGMQKY